MSSVLSDIKRTSEGYLQNYEEWTPVIAEAIAAELDIALTPERWFVINFLRTFMRSTTLLRQSVLWSLR